MFDFFFFGRSILLLRFHDFCVISLENVIGEGDQSYLVLNLFNLNTHTFDWHSFGQDIDQVVEECVHHFAYIPVELRHSLVWLEEAFKLDEVIFTQARQVFFGTVQLSQEVISLPRYQYIDRLIFHVFNVLH